MSPKQTKAKADPKVKADKTKQEASVQANGSPAVDPLGPGHPWSFVPLCQPAKKNSVAAASSGFPLFLELL